MVPLTRQQTSTWDDFCSCDIYKQLSLCRVVWCSDDPHTNGGTICFITAFIAAPLWTSMASVNPSLVLWCTETTSSPVLLFQFQLAVVFTSIPSGSRLSGWVLLQRWSLPRAVVFHFLLGVFATWVVSGNFLTVLEFFLGSVWHIPSWPPR